MRCFITAGAPDKNLNAGSGGANTYKGVKARYGKAGIGLITSGARSAKRISFLLKEIITPFPKILELFSGNGRQSWQMAGSDVFCLKIALPANARPKLIRLPASTCTNQIASTCRRSL